MFEFKIRLKYFESDSDINITEVFKYDTEEYNLPQEYYILLKFINK